jgi:hypothetical protein
MTTREGWLERVKEEEAKIVVAEGWFTVNNRYFAREEDAALQRRWHAEVLASRAIARDVLRRHGCSWCGKPISADQESVAAAGAQIHATPCAEQFAEFTGEAVSAVDRWAAA